MRKYLTALTISVVAVLMIIGCGTPRTEPTTEGRKGTTTTPTAGTERAGETTPSTPQAVIRATGPSGTPITAGTWILTVRETEIKEKVGKIETKTGQFVVVEIDLTNKDSVSRSVAPNDFTLINGSTTFKPMETGDEDLTPSRTIPAGKTEDVKAVFKVMHGMRSFSLIFEPADGTPVRIGVSIP